MGIDINSTHDDVGAKQWMEFPHRRTFDSNALNQNVAAAIEFNKARAQERALAKLPFLDRHILVDHLAQAIARKLLIRTSLFGPSTSFPLPPVFVAGLSIERAFTSDGDIFLLERVNERRVVVTFHSLKPRKNHRQISLGV